MAEPIRKPRDFAAPTPQNTPASASSVKPPSRAQSQPMASISEDNALGALANNPALLSMIQGRLGTLVGRSSGYIESLPSYVRDRLAGLKGLRLKNAEIEADFQRELLELEKKYFKLQEPLYARRTKIISGEEEPSVDEIEAGKAAFDEEEELFGEGSDEESENEDEDEDAEDSEPAAKPASADAADEPSDDEEETVVGIPNFWLTAFRNVPGLSDTLSDRDDDVLRYLTDVRLKYLEKPGFALEFYFADNEFFTNKKLTKTYYYQDEVGITGDFVYDHAEGDEINWTSPEVNVTIKVEKRKQRNKHTKATRTIEKTIPVQSFFEFFNPPQPPSLEEEESGEYSDFLQEQLESDFDLGELIKEKIIPRAIDWFTGKALDYEGLRGGEDGDEFDEDEEYDEDEDEDETTDGTSGAEKPAECKQQ